MARILLVDDSSSTRSMVGAELRVAGFEVEECGDAATAAEKALRDPPDAVVTDLQMPGISGVQLCRLLRAEPATAKVPVVLVTADEGRRSVFWARSAGATDYLTKSRLGELPKMLERLIANRPSPAARLVQDLPAGVIPERLSSLLDQALFESTIAGEVRSLAQQGGDIEGLFTHLVRLASEIMSYHWLALAAPGQVPFLLHAHPAGRQLARVAAREALGFDARVGCILLQDERATPGAAAEVCVEKVRFGDAPVGALALGMREGPSAPEDKRVLRLIARELGGPLQMHLLVEEARALAATDALTGLMNRRAFLESAAHEQARAKRNGSTTALLMLDIDHFKDVNDNHGHEAGDRVLKAIAALLLNGTRRSDLVARWGGEEFVVAMPETDLEGARRLAERLRLSMTGAGQVLGRDAKVSVTASIGVVAEPPGWKLDKLIERADAALYLAKQKGRNRVETN